jgi:single-stranded-DNA-specific exonuclease
MNHRWVLRDVPSLDAVRTLAQQLNDLPDALTRALILRGVDTLDRARSFFRPALTHLHDPLLMADMETAAARIGRAMDDAERIVVYGDYDVDGTTATALLVQSLRDLGGDVGFFVPDRFGDGYGLSRSGLDCADGLGADLVVSVDCGVTALEEARLAREMGIDLIVCDHHTPKPELPEAAAVLCSKRPDCSYPFKELCGCAVAYKLLQGVLRERGASPVIADAYLDLVAIATASDIVPVHGENRVLLAYGLERIREDPRHGIRALAEAAGLDLATCTARDVLFAIGPRINAAGRLGSAETAVELLLSNEPGEAHRLAAQLETLNRRRRALDEDTRTAATALAERQLTSRMRHSVVLHQDGWHLGVIGIVASRLVDRFHKPTILLGTNNGVATGSARSIAGINVYDALLQCEDLFLEFGGHAAAAGISLEIENVPALQARFDEAIGDVVTPEVLQPAMHVDARLVLDEIDRRFWAVLKQFAPFGPANDRPVFQSDDLHLSRRARRVGRNDAHLKFTVCHNGSAPREVIGFGLGEKYDLLERSWRDGVPVDILYSLDENTWNGRTTLQLNARDLRLAESVA